MYTFHISIYQPVHSVSTRPSHFLRYDTQNFQSSVKLELVEILDISWLFPSLD